MVVHAADIQDADGLWGLLKRVKPLYPWLRAVFADSGCQGAKFQAGLRAFCGRVNLDSVKRSDCHKFDGLPQR